MGNDTPSPVPPITNVDDPVRRVHFRLWQIVMTVFTVVICGWFFTIHVAAGIIALFAAKHVLVAVYAMNLRTHAGPPPPKTP